MAIVLSKKYRVNVSAVFAMISLISTQAIAQERQYASSQIYNIFASSPQSSSNAVEITDAALDRLRRCGIKAASDYTYSYKGMTPGYMVTLSGPYSNVNAANAELRKAKGCGIIGYRKRATLIDGE
jgi:hypothetical protein